MKLKLLIISATSVLLAPVVTNASAIPTGSKRQQPNSHQCAFPEFGYFITPKHITGNYAAAYCQSLGGKLADVNNQNLITLSSNIGKCLGPNKRVRIQTWDANSFGTSDLALSNGLQSGAGTVNVVGNNEELFALCEMVQTEAPMLSSSTSNNINNNFLVISSQRSGANNLNRSVGYQPGKIQVPEEEDNSEDEDYTNDLELGLYGTDDEDNGE